MTTNMATFILNPEQLDEFAWFAEMAKFLQNADSRSPDEIAEEIVFEKIQELADEDLQSES